MSENIKEADFEDKVIKASSVKPVVVDFWAEWCGPCKAMAPIFDETATEYGEKASFVKVNVDEEPALSQKFGVMSIPTTIYFKDGKPSGQSVGLIDKSELKTHIDKLL